MDLQHQLISVYVLTHCYFLDVEITTIHDKNITVETSLHNKLHGICDNDKQFHVKPSEVILYKNIH